MDGRLDIIFPMAVPEVGMAGRARLLLLPAPSPSPSDVIGGMLGCWAMWVAVDVALCWGGWPSSAAGLTSEVDMLRLDDGSGDARLVSASAAMESAPLAFAVGALRPLPLLTDWARGHAGDIPDAMVVWLPDLARRLPGCRCVFFLVAAAMLSLITEALASLMTLLAFLPRPPPVRAPPAALPRLAWKRKKKKKN